MDLKKSIGCRFMKLFNFRPFNIFRKNPKIIQEQKNYYQPCSSFQSRQSFIDFLLGQNEYKLAANQTIAYFYKCAPLFDGIDRLAQAISSIQPMVYDPKSKEFLPDHPLNDLLKNPNFQTSMSDFIYQYAAFLILTGDNYMFVNSVGENAEPRQMFIRPPQAISMNIGSDGFVESYIVNLHNNSIRYERQPDINQGFKYINSSNGITSQLFHSKTFNPTTQDFGIKGCSVLNSIYYEIEQYISTGIHNLSLLKRGATLSGVFKTEARLQDDDYMRLKAQINEYYSGDSNAGKTLVADNGLSFESMQQTNRDMDFLQLKELVTTTIYNILRIPLPLISKDTMTLANIAASKITFYDNGVLPWIDRIYDDLSNFLLPRYPGSENYEIFYNVNDIMALETRKVDNLTQVKDIGVLTTNELRAQLNYEPLEGGDDLYQSSSNVPFASDTNTDNNNN